MSERVRFTIFGDPVAFARAGSFGKRRFTPPKQRDFMLEARRVAHEAMEGRQLLSGPLSATVEAIYEIPASWSAKKRAAARWKTSRPDVDNLAKVILDAIGDNPSLGATDKFGPIVYLDDAAVCDLRTVKCYGARACVVVSVCQVLD